MQARGFTDRPAPDPDEGQGCPGWPAGRRGRVGGQCRQYSARHRQRQRRPDRQYPAAPGLVSAPKAPSVPRRARVSERTIRVSTPGGPAARLPQCRGAARAVSTPNWPHCRPSHIQHERTNERARAGRLKRTGPLAAVTGPRPALTCELRPAGRWRPPPARNSDERPPPHSKPARSEPDPGPCLRPGGYGTGQ